jgi:hypothetical protein
MQNNYINALSKIHHAAHLIEMKVSIAKVCCAFEIWKESNDNDAT